MSLGHAIKVLRRHPRPLRLVAARLLQRTGLSRLFTIRLDGYSLRFFPTNVSANLWINPASRFHDLSLFADYCRPGDVVIDVGANIGEVAIVCSQRVGATGEVFAFEPHPRIAGYLRGNLALNECDNVVVKPVALAAAPSVARLSDDFRDDMNRVIQDGAIEVKCSTLDDEAPRRQVALLKIDVEGSELDVLRGGPNTLALTACVNCELIEEHCRRYGHAASDVIRQLRGAGFNTYIIDGPRQLLPVDETYVGTGPRELIAIRDSGEFARRTGWRVQ